MERVRRLARHLRPAACADVLNRDEQRAGCRPEYDDAPTGSVFAHANVRVYLLEETLDFYEAMGLTVKGCDFQGHALQVARAERAPWQLELVAWTPRR